MLKDKLRPSVLIYGPYLRKDGRKHIVLYWPKENKRQTISYPKWLMEQHLGRFLTEDETIDHKNRDFTDDRIENFEILSKAAHAKIDVIRSVLDESLCIYCKAKIMRLARNRRRGSKLDKAGPFCSKQCSGKYGADVRFNEAKLPAQDSPASVYYQLDKSKC